MDKTSLEPVAASSADLAVYLISESDGRSGLIDDFAELDAGATEAEFPDGSHVSISLAVLPRSGAFRFNDVDTDTSNGMCQRPIGRKIDSAYLPCSKRIGSIDKMSFLDLANRHSRACAQQKPSSKG